ncbi:MAG: hypothetical protein AAGB46_15205, partial [Verrucomicrobiota bacterium]
MKPFALLFPCILLTVSGPMPAAERDPLKFYASFDAPIISESSGFVKSRAFEDLYWTHNDSGDAARIFAVNRNGQIHQPDWFQGDYQGIAIGNATNIDWEDIAIDGDNNLYIGAFGNNGNARRDLAIYVVPEPNYKHALGARALKTIPVAYPDQDSFPPARSERNFDCEALFYANEKLYMLSKNRGDNQTKLYRLDSEVPNEVNVLTLIDSYDVQGQVTGADSTPDGSKIAVLTYNAIWLFEKPEDSDNYLDGDVSVKWIGAGQCEGICFDDDETLIITNEQAKLYEVKLS